MAKLGILTSPLSTESGEIDGFAYVPSTLDPVNQHRSSSQASFLDYATHTTSIKVYTHALARQVLSSNNKTANGALVESGRRKFTSSAMKEVILSAGVFQSPLLMLSSIGPRQTLTQYDTPIIADLPSVGQNLQDQPFFSIQNRVDVPSS